MEGEEEGIGEGEGVSEKVGGERERVEIRGEKVRRRERVEGGKARGEGTGKEE